MADIKFSDEGRREIGGERSERGPRGPTGPIGAASTMAGPAGPAGPTGATGPAAPSDVDAAVFDDSVPAAQSNIRENRAINRSPIDNTKSQITNLGSQDGTINAGASGATGIAATIGGGDDNTASGNYSTVPGGGGNTASADFSFAEGKGTTASDVAAHAEGEGTIAEAEAAHAEGFNTISGGPGSHAEGVVSIAAAQAAHAEGGSTIASGANSHAEGFGTTAQGLASHASGSKSVARLESQDAYASGGAIGNAPASAQTSRLVLWGQTPGVAPNESIELAFGLSFTGQLTLENGKAYMFRVAAVAGAVQAGPTRKMHWIEFIFGARHDAGVTTLVGGTVIVAQGSDAGTPFTWTPTVGVAPDRIAIIFATGASTSAAKVTALVDYQEVIY